MAEVTNELMYELLKKLHTEIGALRQGQSDIRTELGAMRGTMVSIHQDLHNIYGVLARHENRLDRIEHRLELRELQEAQASFEPHP